DALSIQQGPDAGLLAGHQVGTRKRDRAGQGHLAVIGKVVNHQLLGVPATESDRHLGVARWRAVVGAQCDWSVNGLADGGLDLLAEMAHLLQESTQAPQLAVFATGNIVPGWILEL